MKSKVEAIQWRADQLVLLDQRKLPQRIEFIHCETARSAAQAIKDMVVRGAPAIGITAAFAIALAARQAYAQDTKQWRELIQADLQILGAARPTAVNLFWAIQEADRLFTRIDGNPFPILLNWAQDLLQQDCLDNQAMGKLGASLIEPNSGVLTHCNAGALATGGYGTALGVIRAAHAEGKLSAVYADETRPWLQGARLTAWELLQDNIEVCLLADAAAAHLMKQGKVQWLIVGSDRIAANGDVANKIGTYQAAISAKYHGVKVMVAAPTSTIDLDMPNGAQIPIEDRNAEEILSLSGKQIAASGAKAYNPVFDVTPAELVDVIVTEKCIIRPPFAENIAQSLEKIH